MEQLSGYTYLVAPLLGWVVAQSIKIYLSLRKDGIELKDAVQSGGMPSSHTAFMVAITTAVAIGEGLASASFAIVLAVTAVVVYDAAGVRRTTGEQTGAINALADKTKTKIELMHNAQGHKPIEIFWGAVVGLGVGLVTSYLM